jgi:uncharacterized tellurite resistance protein B-like protein
MPAMLADLVRRLAGPPTRDPLDPEDARLALAALMVRLARSDESYAAEEQRRIDALLAAHYRLEPAEAARVRAEAELAEAQAQDTVQFTRLIKQAVPYDERAGIVETLWRVAASGGINADEHGLMRLVANLLGVSDQDSGLARQRALRRE